MDAWRNLWVTTMHIAGREPIGRLLRRTPAGRWTTVWRGRPILNGPAFDPLHGVAYVADTTARTIHRFACASPDDVHAPRTLFATFTEGDGSPDGMTVDAFGRLWVAHYAGARVTCRTVDGTIVHDVALPVRNPTSVAIGGGTLFITSARDDRDRGAVRGGTLFALPLPSPDTTPR